MRRLILTSAAILSLAFAISGREIYSTEGIPCPTGVISTDTLPETWLTIDYHLRVELPRNAMQSSWSLHLGYTDGSTTNLTFSRNGRAIDETVLGIPVELDVEQSKYCSATSVSHRHAVTDQADPSIDAWSVTIKRGNNSDSVHISVGQRSPSLSLTLPAIGLRVITSSALTPLKLIRLSCFTTETDDLCDTQVVTREALDKRLEKTTHPIEGYWVYLDRDTDPLRLRLGGRYTLAAVMDADGVVELIYLDGAPATSSVWKPMMLKGRLHPTIFANHYDLTWYDASCTRIDSETSADLIDDTILRLNFPLHGGSVRLQKHFLTPSGPSR